MNPKMDDFIFSDVIAWNYKQHCPEYDEYIDQQNQQKWWDKILKPIEQIFKYRGFLSFYFHEIFKKAIVQRTYNKES